MLSVVSEREFLWSSWVPVQKAHGEHNTEGKRIVYGKASTGNQDQQRETVMQKGLDWSPLMRSGIINWNHASIADPAAIIGEPLDAGLDEHGEFYIKAMLYEGLPKADAAWDLLCYYEAHPELNRRLGWSIEGSGLRKGNIVERTIIRHVALTHDPVNADTFASVCKAMCCGLDACELTPMSKALSTISSAPLLLENLDSGKTMALLRHLFFGTTPQVERIFSEEGGRQVYKQGPLSAFDQLVAHGIEPIDASAFLRDLRDARFFNIKGA